MKQLFIKTMCFFLGHWWSDWLMGERWCWACWTREKFRKQKGK